MILLVIQIFTGLPVFSGTLSLLKRAGQQTVEGIQEFRDEMKRRAEEGDAEAKARLLELDTILAKHQDASVKAHIAKLKETE